MLSRRKLFSAALTALVLAGCGADAREVSTIDTRGALGPSDSPGKTTATVPLNSDLRWSALPSLLGLTNITVRGSISGPLETLPTEMGGINHWQLTISEILSGSSPDERSAIAPGATIDVLEVVDLPVSAAVDDGADEVVVGLQFVGPDYASSTVVWRAAFVASATPGALLFHSKAPTEYTQVFDNYSAATGSRDPVEALLDLTEGARLTSTTGTPTTQVADFDSAQAAAVVSDYQAQWLASDPATRGLQFSNVPPGLVANYEAVGLEVLTTPNILDGLVRFRSADGVVHEYRLDAVTDHVTAVLRLPGEALTIEYIDTAGKIVQIGTVEPTLGKVTTVSVDVTSNPPRSTVKGQRDPTKSELHVAQSMGIGPDGKVSLPI